VNTVIRKYEAVLVIDPKLEEEALEAVVTKYSDLVTNNGGEIVKIDRWGKRRLAYEIEDNLEGYYVVMQFSADSAIAQEMERQIKISEDVFRHLIVREDE
jgi:small subunit ribosomal protein S6